MAEREPQFCRVYPSLSPPIPVPRLMLLSRSHLASERLRNTCLETVDPIRSAGTSMSDMPPPPSLHLPSGGEVENHVFKIPLEDLCLRVSQKQNLK